MRRIPSSTPASTIATTNASPSGFQKLFSKARPPKYPSAVAKQPHVIAATRSAARKRNGGNRTTPAENVTEVRPPGM
jgi:hypothetical protein